MIDLNAPHRTDANVEPVSCCRCYGDGYAECMCDGSGMLGGEEPERATPDDTAPAKYGIDVEDISHREIPDTTYAEIAGSILLHGCVVLEFRGDPAEFARVVHDAKHSDVVLYKPRRPAPRR